MRAETRTKTSDAKVSTAEQRAAELSAAELRWIHCHLSLVPSHSQLVTDDLSVVTIAPRDHNKHRSLRARPHDFDCAQNRDVNEL